MVPIYDTDLAESRWSQAEWEQYELWEKVEQRLKRRKRFWILGTAVLFLVLFSLPIVADQRPKWQSLAAARQLAQEINLLKKSAALDHHAYRLRFEGAGSVRYSVFQQATCDAASTTEPPRLIRSGELSSTSESMVVMTPEQGQTLNVPGLVEELCYDALTGSALAHAPQQLVGFGLIPERDLADRRTDRLSVLIVSGASAELSFE